ncbi:MAG: 1,4-alpha-glucan branching protein GlgB, partial [Lentisphaeria bacterium]|nr:1,4-alpha-glucan branching protein GlgB [Lentisphaeria bacterium]
QLVAHCQDLGFSHIELLPVNEHPFDGSWGYQATGYFAPTSRFGSPEDFMYFVDYCHQNQIGVILDWVPAHFPRDTFALSYFDGSALYEHADPRQGEHPDWGTKIFNYERNEVRNFLVASAHFWLDKYHIDGIRVDAVASMIYLDYSRKAGEWIPNKYGGRENLAAIEFLRQMNESVYQRFPGVVTIAEESTAWPGVSKPVYAGGLGFGMKWNMGWMHDILHYFQNDPVHRKYHHNNLTFGLMYAFNENFLLPLSHDEVVHGKKALLSKMPGSYEEQFANLRLLYGFMWTYPGKKLLFMGSEFGQWNEWNAEQGLDWNLTEFPIHQGLLAWIRDLNRLLLEEPGLHQVDFHPSGFQWIDFHDVENSVISYQRQHDEAKSPIIVIFNFTPVPRHHYAIRVPDSGEYRVILTSDAEKYGGFQQGSDGILTAQGNESGENHLSLSLPPLGCLILKREPYLPV